MTEDFTATHKLKVGDGEILVYLEKGVQRARCIDQNGDGHKWTSDALTLLPSPVIIRAPKPVDALVVSQEGGTEAKPRITVSIHANAAFAALKAACYPEWENAHGYGESGRADSAQLLNERGPNGEKKVRVCQVNAGRRTEFFDLLIPEMLEFEVSE